MREFVEKWLEKKKDEEEKAEIEQEKINKAKRDKLLIANGLYNKVYVDKPDDTTFTRHEVDKNGKERPVYFHKVAVELTDEEYAAVLPYLKRKQQQEEDTIDNNPVKDNDKTGENIKKMSTALLVITLILGTVLGIAMLTIGKSIWYFIGFEIGFAFMAVFQNSFLSGFGHIVSDIKEIKNKLNERE